MERLFQYLFVVILIALGSVALAYLSSGFMSEEIKTGKITIIPVEGDISLEGGSGGTSSDWLVGRIKEADNDELTNAIVFRINSGGGSAVPCMEIIDAIKNTTKLKVAWIREIAGSCAYMIAAVSDYVIADNYSMVGGIGVISSYNDFSGLMEKYGVKNIRLVSGKFKDTGSPYKNTTEEEIDFLQEMVDEMAKDVYGLVFTHRNITEAEKYNVSQGKIYLGRQALQFGLIDEIGSENEVNEYIKEQMNLTKVIPFEIEKQVSIWDFLNLKTETQSQESKLSLS